MSHRSKLLTISILVMVATSLIVVMVSFRLLYNASFDSRADDLLHTVRSQARLMEAVAKVDLAANDHDPVKAIPVTLGQFIDAHGRFDEFGATGEFTLAKKDGDQIVFLLRHRHGGSGDPRPVPWSSDLAAPMRRALSGQSGTMVGLDYRGTCVLAAHEPVAGLNWGVVAKMDLAEVRWPFVKAGLIAAVSAVLLILAGAAVIVRTGNPLIDRLEQVETAMRESEKRLRLVVESSSSGMVMIDSEGAIHLVNAETERQFGFDRRELLGKPIEMLIPERFRDEHPKHRASFFARPESRRMGMGRDLYGRRSDGSEFPVEIGLNTIETEEGWFVLASIVDIAERKGAETALRESEERFRELFENANDLIQAITPQGRFVYVNPAWSRTVGYGDDEIDSLTIFDIIHPDSLDHCKKLFGEVISGKDVGVIEAAFRTRDGRKILVEGNASCQFDEEGRPVATRAIFRDITYHKQAEAMLREDVRLAQLQYDIHVVLSRMGSMQDALQSCAAAVVEHLDAAFARIWTLNEQENILELQASAGMYTHLDGPHSRVPVGKLKIGLIAQERQPHLTNAVLGDPRVGDQRWAKKEGMVAFAGYPLMTADRVIGVMAMFARHQLSENALHAMGGIAQGVALGIDRIRAEGELRAALNALAKRKAELEVATKQAESADRLKSAFLATMSHELRTPMNSIIGFTGIMLKRLAGPLNDEQAKQLGMVQSSARHLLHLINDVLDISKIEAGQLEIASTTMNLREVIEKTIKSVAPLAREKHLSLRTRIAPEVGEIVSDQRRLEQILLNLVNNAVKFTDEGEVCVACELSGGRVVTRVTDTGCGIKPQDMGKLFESFRQLDSGVSRRHEGTGLGLAICKRLVNLLGGEISVESEWGVGSTFTFALPMHLCPSMVVAEGGTGETQDPHHRR